ncbi:MULTISPECIES: IclR family transcriptional regulator [unclassified Arthrobacter]|uniref:IclR family transcriptional regulator n=1 Tax=unclassified Arthrobacter TaxID=235627 RepID=UPI002DF7DA3C|nr:MULTISPECIES: IclR family transcriptional regulator [unclassified Arthrobacter]MEC5192365.1 DNA-binding IclR family transcriptional regulator [Arthrobacter sp. MP_M4]MEC5203850.1 DNA-binding IclR family transcriptional regulator [Arthrobacter sp. MP_M7]
MTYTPQSPRDGSSRPARRNSSGLRRDLELLEILGSPEAVAASGLGVSKVAETAGRDKAQVSRTLATLAEAGLVSRDPDTLLYSLGYGLYALAARTAEARMVSVSAPYLKRVSAATHETTHLCVLRGGTVLTLKSEMSNHTYRALGWEGVSVDAWGTSSGRVLISDWDTAALRDWYDVHASRNPEERGPGSQGLSPLALESGQVTPNEHAPFKIETFEELCAEMTQIRRRGYAVVDEEFELGVVGVSAPVYDFKQRIIAAFNVSAPKQRFGRHLEQAGVLAARVAMEFSTSLGAPKELTRTRR